MKICNEILFFVIIIGIFFGFNGFAVGRVQQQRHNGPMLTDGQTVFKLYQIMKDVHEVLQLKKVQYWAMGGTLLGAVRHHGLIPWDDDLDICIDKKQINDFASLQPIFESLGYEVSRRPFGYKIILIEKNQAKTKAKVFMDVFLYEQKGNKIYYLWRKFRYTREDKGVPIYANELYPLKDYEFGSLIIKGPHNPYNYLCCCYGKQCLNVANYGGGHNPHLRKKYGKFRLSVKDKAPAMPTGPLLDRVLLSRACEHCPLEVVQFDKDSPEKSRQVLASLCPVFIRSFEKQSELQLKEEHPNEYIALNKAGMTIRDVLLERFNKIVETVLMQVGMVKGSSVTILKNEKGVVIGYSLFTQAPINQLLQSMISRGYITSIISLPEKLLCSKNAVEEDVYILSVAVDPSYQKQGLGKKLIFAIRSYCPAVKNIYLLTAASQTNIEIQKFYEYLGFERRGLFITSDNNQKILYSLTLPNTTRFGCVDDSW